VSGWTITGAGETVKSEKTLPGAASPSVTESTTTGAGETVKSEKALPAAGMDLAREVRAALPRAGGEDSPWAETTLPGEESAERVLSKPRIIVQSSEVLRLCKKINSLIAFRSYVLNFHTWGFILNRMH